MGFCCAEYPDSTLQSTAYHADAVYLYGLHDDPSEPRDGPSSGTPRRKRRRVSVDSSEDEYGTDDDELEDQQPSEREQLAEMDVDKDDENDDKEDEEEDREREDVADDQLRGPLVMPRVRCSGASNIATVKDVNFIGQHDEFIVSGSDDGNWCELPY